MQPCEALVEFTGPDGCILQNASMTDPTSTRLRDQLLWGGDGMPKSCYWASKVRDVITV